MAGAASAPVNTSLPTTSGTAQDGKTLTGSPGSWSGSPSPSYSYTWLGCDNTGSNCTQITGATSKTYKLTHADVGRTVRVLVTAKNSAGSASATSAQTAVVVAAPPLDLSGPTISGTLQDGQTLTAGPGSWSGTPPLSYTYRWRRCDSTGASCVAIAGATLITYLVASADVGHTLRVYVTATNTVGSSSASSVATAVVTAAPPANTAAPTISGTTNDGQTLTAGPGSWSGTPPLSYTYQWQRCDAGGGSCQNVAGATSPTYALGPADVSSRLRVSVSAANAAGSASAVSGVTGVIGSAATHDPVVVAVGDIACPAGDTTHACRQQQTASVAASQSPDDVLVLGDNQYNSGTFSEYQSAGAYNATWGVFGPIVHPVPGNHEYGTSGAAGYFQYFGSAVANPDNTPHGYYSFNIGTWHVDALNSNCTDSGCSDPLPGSTTSAQTSWLQSDLAANRSACVLAMWHHPLFSDGWTLGSPGVAPLWSALYNAHADLVLGGHDHLYERYAQLDPSGTATANGIREFVVGTGGESLNGLGSSNPNLQASDTHDFGVLVLTLHPTSYDYKFISTSGTVKDSGTGVACHGPGTSGAAIARAARGTGGSGTASAYVAPGTRAPRAPGLSGPPLVFDAHPLHSSLTAVLRQGLPVEIHASRGVDVKVTVSARHGHHLQRIASYYETESEIPKPYSRILLRLPAARMEGVSHVTLVLRFAALDSARHHRVVTRIVPLKRR